MTLSNDAQAGNIEAGGWHDRSWMLSTWLDGWHAACIRNDGPHAVRPSGGGHRAAGNVRQGCGADPPAEVRAVPSSRRDGADVVADLSRDAAVGALDQKQSVQPRDAAVVHRQEHRHPEVQERGLVE